MLTRRYSVVLMHVKPQAICLAWPNIRSISVCVAFDIFFFSSRLLCWLRWPLTILRKETQWFFYVSLLLVNAACNWVNKHFLHSITANMYGVWSILTMVFCFAITFVCLYEVWLLNIWNFRFDLNAREEFFSNEIQWFYIWCLASACINSEVEIFCKVISLHTFMNQYSMLILIIFSV